MKLLRAIKLQQQYIICPDCGSDEIGGGAGKLLIDDKTFMRSCKCGCKVQINDADNEGNTK